MAEFVDPNLDSNLGEVGPNSIRIAGKRLLNLPIAEKALALEQMPGVWRVEREKQVERILKKYPEPSADYIQSRIDECRANISRMEVLIASENQTISEYTGWKQIMEVRAEAISLAEKIEDPHSRAAEIRKIEKRWPPYKREGLDAQIIRSHESIDRANVVISKENASISELTSVLQQIHMRDEELADLGVALRE